MCSIFLAFESHPVHRLIVAANRDEFYDRPTAPAGYWDDAPEVLAGRDLRGGGTWLGLGAGDRFAAVTNHRDPKAPAGRRSRGLLVRDFLLGRYRPEQFLNEVAAKGGEYSGFNLLVADADELWYLSDHEGAPRRLAPGIFGLSNHLLDTPWPKVVRGKIRLESLVRAGDKIVPLDLFQLLADDQLASDPDLPETGIDLARERALSSIFIRTPNYGTRSATVLLMDYNGGGVFCERSFPGPVAKFEERSFDLGASSSKRVSIRSKSNKGEPVNASDKST
jgi:uncharacterized protein with NRDE domain